ncbi:MAG TPA: ethanolamine utilization protein EutN [Kiritimatiellae bacterium]|nr:ethanolamine utilization protein EutN [Kiritimatiellia bacterium]
MKLARVIGRVVPAKISEDLKGVPLLIVTPVAPDGAARGQSVVAADATRMAGPGELVSYESGREAALALEPWFVPVDHAIVGIVDAVELKQLEKLEGAGEE